MELDAYTDAQLAEMNWNQLSKLTTFTPAAIRYRVLVKGMSPRDACSRPSYFSITAKRNAYFRTLGVTYDEVRWFRRRRQHLDWEAAALLLSDRKRRNIA